MEVRKGRKEKQDTVVYYELALPSSESTAGICGDMKHGVAASSLQRGYKSCLQPMVKFSCLFLPIKVCSPEARTASRTWDVLPRPPGSCHGSCVPGPIIGSFIQLEVVGGAGTLVQSARMHMQTAGGIRRG